MPRKNYMSIAVHDTVQQMFDEFVRHYGLSKTVALNDMLEMYMLAKDENLYLELKKKYLNIESMKQMLSDRDNNDLSASKEQFIFMKLSTSYDAKGNEYGAHETMHEYISDQAVRGYTWFSTQSLYYGMSESRVDFYNRAIARGQSVTILFCIGEKAGGNNDIAYKANVIEVKSFKEPNSLDTEDFPSVWHGEKARIWLKIKDLQPEEQLTAKLFKVTSTGADLQQVINNSQYHFGYISPK